MKLSEDQYRQYYEGRLGEMRRNGVSWMARCPFHADRNPSLAVRLDTGAWHCHACRFGGGPAELESRLEGCDIAEALNRVAEAVGAPRMQFDSWRRPEAVYPYTDESGEPLFEVVRFRNQDGSKRIQQRRKNPDGSYTYKVGDVRRVLYRLPDLIVARQAFVVEGEKCADRLRAALTEAKIEGVAVTTNAGGAGKWRPEYGPFFAGRDVCILADNDAPGKAHAQDAAASIAQFGHRVAVIDLPGLAEKGDVADWLDAGHTFGELKLLVQRAPLWRAKATDARLLVPAQQFCATQPEEIEWLVEGVIQRGANGMIAANPKAGKSWLAAALAIAVARGSEWLGFRAKKCPVALISREDTPALTAWRLRRLAAPDGLPDGLWVNSRAQSPEFRLDSPSLAGEMRTQIESRQPGLVILDVMNVMHAADENDQTQVRAVLDAATALTAGVKGCSLCVVHHFAKAQIGEQGITQRLRGSSAIAGWVEWLVGLARDGRSERGRVAAFEIKAGAPPEDVWFSIESNDERAWIQGNSRAAGDQRVQ